MPSVHRYRLFLSAFLAGALLLAGCSTPPAENLPVPTQSGVQPTALPTSLPATPTLAPTLPPVPGTDVEEFKKALLQAMMDGDAQTLEGRMSVDFLTGWWRADGSYTSPADAVRELYTNELGSENHLEWVGDIDLKTLLGDTDPLSFSRSDAGVIEAALVSGWGKDGRDEAILLLAREADNRLKWHGWIIIKGGISGARHGGAQPYANATHGYSFFIPKGFEVHETSASSVTILAPGVGHPGEQRAAAFIEVGPANGSSVEQITEQIKTDLGSGFEIPPGTAMGLDKAMAIVLSGLPGQDSNRQLFVVYNDLLVHITFVPDAPQVGKGYWQMEDLYAMIVNSFHFTN